MARWTTFEQRLAQNMIKQYLLGVGSEAERHEERGDIALHVRRPCTAAEHGPLYPIMAERLRANGGN